MAKRKAVGLLLAELGLSERRDSAEVGLSRSVLAAAAERGCGSCRSAEGPCVAASPLWLPAAACPRRVGLVINRKLSYRL